MIDFHSSWLNHQHKTKLQYKMNKAYWL